MVWNKLSGLFKKKDKDFLGDLLTNGTLRESLLGVGRVRPMSDDKTKSDAARILNFARSEDYSVYAEELWKTTTFYIKELANVNLKPEEIDFYRGCLSATLDDLKISYRAFRFLESERNKPPTPHSGLRRDPPTPGR